LPLASLKCSVVLEPAEVASVNLRPVSRGCRSQSTSPAGSCGPVRKCVTTIGEAGPDGVAVVLSGKLKGGRSILAIGHDFALLVDHRESGGYVGPTESHPRSAFMLTAKGIEFLGKWGAG
jgi:hypothetical protein